MKKKYTLLVLLISLNAFAQIPTNYYNNATGTGYALKTQLAQIISNNTNALDNAANYGGLWTLYTQFAMRDNYYENNSSLLDLYSENPAGPDAYEYTSTDQQCSGSTPSVEGGCYNREHIIPQSVFTSAYPMYSDAHFVLPSDNRVNAWRNTYPFGMVETIVGVPCSNATSTGTALSTVPCFTTNNSRLGQNLNVGYSAGFNGIVFEPINEFKGDVARAILYFVTRYESQIPDWNYAMFNGTSTQGLTDTFLEIMKQWHILDPVSSYEIAKNNIIHYNFQGNRNPFIDNPSYVSAIWSQTLRQDTFELLSNATVFPNPSSDQKINITSEIVLDEIQLININGQIMQQIKNPTANDKTYSVENISSGFYFLRVISENQSVVKKVIVN
jgi:endonuclease I